MAHDLREIEAEAKALIAKHCPMYSFGWMNKKTVLGDCSYAHKRIRLSKFHVLKNDRSITTNTILHEIAHALAGVGNGHNIIWKRWCIQVGANPVRCASVERTGHSWELHCYCEGKVRKYYRKPAHTTIHWSVCTRCRGKLKLKKVA